MPNKLSQFWQELKRRKVLPILIGYLTACVAIIELSSNAIDTFSISKETVRLLYLLSAIGIPFVIVLPWIINRNKPKTEIEETSPKEETSEQESKAKHNLPAQLTTFIGRQKEMQLVRGLISAHRLVSLIGAGGCGKTRLSCEVALKLVEDYKDGAWFVDLAPLTEQDLVGREILEVLAINEVPSQQIIETIVNHVKDKNQLIILDNCEHVLEACAEITGRIGQSASGVDIVATSREALGVKGEQVWRVPSLSLIDPKKIISVDNAKDAEAVRLFTDRAQLNNPEFELVTENVTEVNTICNKLDGIPLAVELVASRTRNMNPKMILDRFSDRFEKLASTDPGTSMRQKTLQATIEWSFNLLSDPEKILFTRLGIFYGSFDLKAAETICSDDLLQEETIMDLLSRLVDKSLVSTIKGPDQSMRYILLVTLHQFAHQLILKREEQIILGKKHFSYYLSIAEEGYEEQFESQHKWLALLFLEQDNIQAAISFSLKNSEHEFCRLISTLPWYWLIKSQYNLAKEYLEKANAINIQDPETRARILFGLGNHVLYFGESERHMELLENSLSIWRDLGNLREQANILGLLGYIYLVHYKERDKGINYGKESLELSKRTGAPGLINHCLMHFCSSMVHSKQFEEAFPFVEELIVSSEELNQPMEKLTARHYHSDCTLGIKDYWEAERRYGLGMKTALEYGNILVGFGDMQGIAFALSGQSRFAKCLRLNAASEEKARSIGMTIKGLFEFWDEWIETYIYGAKKEVGEELAKQYEEEGIAMGFEEAVEYALDFEKD